MPEIRAVRFANPPVIDGRIDDAEWADAPVHAGTGFDEDTGAPGQERSEYRLAYDDKFIYFAAKLTDSQPSQIRATEFRTNVNLGGDDFVGMYIDPFGTFSDGNNFDINPQGATNIRVNGGRAAKREWLGEMEAKARRTAEGWEAEARIPWSVMRLPRAGLNDLRVNFYRVLSRTRRAYIYENIANGRIAQTPVWKGVDVPAKTNERTVKLLPYAYGGYEDRRGIIANSGLDLKYGLTDDIDLIGSINPDFRNIENQVLSVDFSYFERLAGETRPFFLEGSDYFRTSGDAPLFASQRIQSFDAGIKSYGKIGDRTQVAVLNTGDFGEESATVGTVRQNFGPRTNMTVAGTQLTRRGLENSASFIGGGHGWGPWDVFFQHQSTRDTERGHGRRVNTGLNYNKDGFFGGGEWVEVTPQFLPRLGFAPQTDFRGYNAYAGMQRLLSKGPLQGWEFNLGGIDWRTFGGDNFISGVNGFASITLRNGTDLDMGFNFEKFRQNDDKVYFFDYDKANGDPYRNAGFHIETGEIAGRSYTSISPRISLRPLPRLQLSGTYQSVRHYDVSDQTILTASYDLNMADSVSGRFIQQDRRTSWYLAYRRTGNKGAEYYVILGEPRVNIDRSFQASLILKAVFPIDWKL
ncbi:MAG: DUF5916 domain-containing protein [Fimbriimonas sp.]